MPYFKSRTTLDTERSFSLLKQDDYELIIDEVKPTTQSKYNAKPDKNGVIPQEDIVNVKLKVLSCKDGSEPTDEEGKDAVGRIVFFTARPGSSGFMKDGTPSKTRSFVAYALNKSVDDDIEFGDWEELLGKTLYAEVIQKVNTKGVKKNVISRFVLPPKGKKKVAPIKEEEIPVIEEPTSK